MAFLAPAAMEAAGFALEGVAEFVADNVVDVVIDGAWKALDYVGTNVFGFAPEGYEAVSSEVELLNVNTESYAQTMLDASADERLAAAGEEAEQMIVQMTETGADENTPLLQSDLERLAGDAEYRSSIMKKVVKAAIVAGVTLSAEEIARRTYAYVVSQHPQEDILTHHEHITGQTFMAATSVSKKKKRSKGRAGKKYKISDAAIARAVANYTNPGSTTSFSTRHNLNSLDINYNNIALTTAGCSYVIPLLHAWSGANTWASITGGIARGTNALSERIGDVITIRKINLAVGIAYPTASQTLPPVQKFNLYIFYDNDYDRVWPSTSSTDLAATKIFEAGGMRMDAYRTRNGASRFKLLKKATLDFSNYAAIIPSGATYPPFQKSVTMTVNCNKQIIYETGDNTGTYDKIRHGQLYFCLMGSSVTSGTPVYQVNMRGTIEYDP